MTQQVTASRNVSLLERRQAAVPRGPFHVAQIFVERASGSRLWDVDGKEYLDFCGGIGVLNVGHNHPRVVAAVEAQLKQFVHTSFHVAMYEGYVRLAERLNDLVPVDGTCRTCFFNSGAEAIENAVKISRMATGRPAVIAFERGFHGRTLLAMTLTGKKHPYAAGFGPFAPEVYRLPYAPFFGRPDADPDEVEGGCREALEHLFAYHVDKAAVACVIVEPVLGEGGFLPLQPRAATILRETADRYGFLLIADEVQTGFGRCGSLFAMERFDCRPDVVTTAKSLGGGLPLSGVTAARAVIDAPGVGGIGGTFGGNPLACAAANAVLDIMADEGLPERARKIGARVMEVFEALVSDCDIVGEARGLGAMCGLEIIDPETGGADADRAQQITARCLEDGLLVMTASGNVLRTLMPLTIPWDDLDQGLAILDKAVRAQR